jgi:hypothetical protein
MAAYEQGVDSKDKRTLYLIRPSYLNQAKHINDVFLNMGYNYRGNILKNGSSPELWSNPQQIGMFSKIEGMIVFLIESTKIIKKSMSIAHTKETSNIN